MMAAPVQRAFLCGGSSMDAHSSTWWEGRFKSQVLFAK